MKTHILLLALVGLATGFVLPTFAHDTVDPTTAQQIDALAAKFNEAFNKHDPAACAAFYTQDAVWNTYHGIFRGRQRIEQVYKEWCFEYWNKKNWTTTFRKVIRVGDEVRAIGFWSCNPHGSGYDQGNCTWVLVRKGDTWQIRSETLTSDNFNGAG